MESLSRYLAHDRRQALAQGRTLPDRAVGAALFADLAGFSAWGQRLTLQVGERRGVEELAQRINAVYETLIGEVERHGGSVVGFAGDALTCWFDDADSGAMLRGLGCAFAMQAGTAAFEGIGVKVALASGAVRRLTPGAPDIQLMDTLAGAVIARLAVAEQLASPGEIVIDPHIARALDGRLRVREWRSAPGGEAFAVVCGPPEGGNDLVGRGPVRAEAPALSADVLRPWLLPAVVEHELAGHGAFLTELRPTVALFLRFEGIDYDGDDHAGERLDRLVRRVQTTLAAHDGVLLQLTIGDKGSYCYGALGVPVVHEDDASRAVRAAHELMQGLRELGFLAPVQIGLSAGIARAGAYGARTRATYGVLGDDVNLAARLMALARPGEILLSEAMRRPAAPRFVLRALEQVAVKGHAEPMRVHVLVGPRRERTAPRVQERRYGLAMVGRQGELALIERKLALAAEGQGQVIGISGEAGIGKSRLVAEVVPFAQRHGFVSYAGLCDAAEQRTPYLVWRPAWRALLDVDAEADDGGSTAALRERLRALAPARVDALPTLAPLLGVTLEDNDFTRTLAPEDRANVLSALLQDCLKFAAAAQPLLIVLEDVHWIDPASLQLLEDLVRTSANLPLVFVLAYRPPEGGGAVQAQVERLPGFTRIVLDVLAPGDVERLVDNRLAQWEPGCSDELAAALAAKLNARAEGNPFYIEELLNHLCERHTALHELAADASRLAAAPPTSVQALILGRIDGLSEPQRATLKAASVIGRHFRVDWLHGCYPELGALERVKADLAELARLELTPLDTPEPELAYLFKHALTREVAYESMPTTTRAQLHEQFARYIEVTDAERNLDLLAHHYGLSHNREKQREYLRRAGEAAQGAYANEAAIGYFERLLPLLADAAERFEICLRRGNVLEHVGRWDEADAAYLSALEAADASGDVRRVAAAAQRLGMLCASRNELDAAHRWLEQAVTLWESSGEQARHGEALALRARVYMKEVAHAETRAYARRAARISRQTGDRATESLALALLGWVARSQNRHARARFLSAEAVARARSVGDKRLLAARLNNLALAEDHQGGHEKARDLYEEALSLAKEVGHMQGAMAVQMNLGNVYCFLGEYSRARQLLSQCAQSLRAQGARSKLATTLIGLGFTALCEEDLGAARAYLDESLEIFRTAGSKLFRAYALNNRGYVWLAEKNHEEARVCFHEALTVSQAMGDSWGTVYSLFGIASLLASTGAGQGAALVATAAEHLADTARKSVLPFLRRMQDATLATARASLAPGAFDAAAAEGQTLAPADSVALALRWSSTSLV